MLGGELAFKQQKGQAAEFVMETNSLAVKADRVGNGEI
jgi:hypothetical protein